MKQIGGLAVKRKTKAIIAGLLAAVLLTAGGFWLFAMTASYGYAREVPESEQALRASLITAAESWLGCSEADGSHAAVIDLYNSHTPLAQGYLVQYDDNWCSTFVSAAAIQAGLTDRIPTECGCQRHIGLFEEIGCWVEDDSYVPLPGDIIFYCWSDKGVGDCTGWSNHVGIVVGTAGPFIKVIEGNYGNAVGYRIIPVNFPGIRGYGTPNYA